MVGRRAVARSRVRVEPVHPSAPPPIVFGCCVSRCPRSGVLDRDGHARHRCGVEASPFGVTPYLHRRLTLARRRWGADRLQIRCSAPPAHSPSAWPRSHNWPGRSSPPSSPSENRHARPRAHRTCPVETLARHTARCRCWSRYLTRPTMSRTRSPHNGRAELLMPHGRPELLAAQLAPAWPGSDPTPSGRARTSASLGAVPLIPVQLPEMATTTRADLVIKRNHLGSSGREKIRAGVLFESRAKKTALLSGIWLQHTATVISASFACPPIGGACPGGAASRAAIATNVPWNVSWPRRVLRPSVSRLHRGTVVRETSESWHASPQSRRRHVLGTDVGREQSSRPGRGSTRSPVLGKTRTGASYDAALRTSRI